MKGGVIMKLNELKVGQSAVITAVGGEGVSELVDRAYETAKGHVLPAI